MFKMKYLRRHCEEQSDEAIYVLKNKIAALPLVARNDIL